MRPFLDGVQERHNARTPYEILQAGWAKRDAEDLAEFGPRPEPPDLDEQDRQNKRNSTTRYGNARYS